MGKHLIKFLIPNVPYKIKNNTLDNIKELEWSEPRGPFADRIIDMITQDYIPNLKQIIINKTSLLPIDYESKPTTSIRGTLACGSLLPYQTKSMRPIPQLANYKVSLIDNVYLCGTGSYLGTGVSIAHGRNSAQAIFKDIGIDFQ
jgi:phytoene dehydrogenase-like protein